MFAIRAVALGRLVVEEVVAVGVKCIGSAALGFGREEEREREGDSVWDMGREGNGDGDGDEDGDGAGDGFIFKN